MDRRYWPQQFDGSDPTPVSWINEPIIDAVPLRPGQSLQSRPLHAVLVESLNHTKALLSRLEHGVYCARPAQHELVRVLFVAARHQRDALTAVLELEGLE